MKRSYLAKNICEGFNIPPRSIQYWLDRNYITADIRDRQPREYSLRQALYAGLTQYILDRGVVLERANRIARYTVSAWLAGMKLADRLHSEPEVTTSIYNNTWIVISTVLKDAEGNGALEVNWVGAAANEGIDGREAGFLEGNFEEVYTLNAGVILNRFMESIGAYRDEIKDVPKDDKIGVIPAEYPGNPDNKKLLVIVEKEN